jgi:hypothetical protein
MSALASELTVEYRHPVIDHDGKRLSTANIIWADRDRGSDYYRVSGYALKAGRFPPNHPCAPFDDEPPINSSQIGGSKRLTAFRERGYWASCFPEGDGITLKWWDDVLAPSEKTAEQVMKDIRECFGWKVERRA